MPVWYLVPDGVVQYIEKRGLYREKPRRHGSDSGPQQLTTDLQEVPR
jgi:nicotinate-nucleotide adenylyltransferase